MIPDDRDGAERARVGGVRPGDAPAAIAKVLDAQARHWGAPLANHLVYARRPELFRGVRGMWAALNRDAILPEALVALVNRRVAALNGCSF